MSVFVFAALVFSEAAVPGYAPGAWHLGMTVRVDEPYVANVGNDKYVTTFVLSLSLTQLHKSGRVGRALKSSGGMGKQGPGSFDAFLDELIDYKLMVIEAESMELDDTIAFMVRQKNFELNLSLEFLRKEEIADKVEIDDEMVMEYLRQKILKEAHGGDEEKEEEKEEEKSSPHQPTLNEKARVELLDIRLAEREAEFFDALMKKSKVKRYEKVLKDLVDGAKMASDTVVLVVNGEKILVSDLMRVVVLNEGRDRETLDEGVESVVLHKVLDQEAMSRGYLVKDQDAVLRVLTWREFALSALFKEDVIQPMVKVGRDDIEAFYEEKKETFKLPDLVHFKAITVMTEVEAIELKGEVEEGANFSFIARKRSIDPRKSGEKGGDVGWVPMDKLSAQRVVAFRSAEEGDIVGPFQTGFGFVICEFIELKDSGYASVDQAEAWIKQVMGEVKFNELLERYIARLRDNIKIEINESELMRMKKTYGG